MTRVVRALRIVLACTFLWVAAPAHAAPSLRADVTSVSAAQSGEATQPRSRAARVARRSTARPQADARWAPIDHACQPRAPRAPPRLQRERFYLKHCVLQR
jgi:hypothetical protein